MLLSHAVTRTKQLTINFNEKQRDIPGEVDPAFKIHSPLMTVSIRLDGKSDCVM